MGFSSGAVTLKRFFVEGSLLDRVDESLLEKLAGHAMGQSDETATDKTHCGWVTGEHILDTHFEWSKNVVGDGLHFALRIDTNKPPADLVRSYQRMNEQAMLEASGRPFLSKVERREARDQATARADAEAESGTFRRMKQVPVYWDFNRNEVYLGTAAASAVDRFLLLFRHTFDRGAVPASAGELASRWATKAGEGSALDNARPACLVKPPEGAAEQDDAIIPGEPRSRDFLGTEWLTWLWYTSHVESADVAASQGHPVTVLFERCLQMECAFKISGTTTINADGPTRLPESSVALASGKRPVRAGLHVAVHGDVYALTVRGDAMNFSGIRLPDPEDGADRRTAFESRVEHLRNLIQGIDALYHAFLKRRLSTKWPQTLGILRNWVAGGAAPSKRAAELAVS
ncbi:MAG TPA: hypothetical protein PKY77_16500 [Phycisphaerae bacterium]|nr:hypothetical protein [Phycisphaerae bacterium]HRY66959.1 hypothetical protein [Phycisphaerae bacterium]HSA27907.1 hypothetical protein [Phycisphaerae bacterium]